jgi:hypothetical protein
MASAADPWTGTWIDRTEPLDAADELVLTVASRRGCPPEQVSEEFAAIDRQFDVDAIYVAPGE